MIDENKYRQKDNPDPEAPADQFFFNWQERLEGRVLKLALNVGLCHRILLIEVQLAKGGLTPAKNSQEIINPTQITNPNKLSK